MIEYRSIAALSAVGLLIAAGWSKAEPATCVTCHQQQADELGKSVHSNQDCQVCHQGATSYELSPAEMDAYVGNGLRSESAPAFDHGSAFAGKPARSEVPDRCGGCHADVERMNPYGLHTDQLARYWTSGHGKTLREKGDDRVAVCIDCHGAHNVLSSREPISKTHPLNIPLTCAGCHSDVALMGDFGISTEVVDEYRRSVHGRLLFEQQDTGAPTCATCHGNHSAMPPGVTEVGAVCGRCHQQAATNYAASVHAGQEEHGGCVRCHGGGEGTHSHLIERITQPTGVLLHRYRRLLATEPNPTPERVAEVLHPEPNRIATGVLPGCMDCHDDLDEDEDLPKLFEILRAISGAELTYVQTGRHLEDVGRGILLVDRQRFMFEDAKTLLIELAPLQHTLDVKKVKSKVAELGEICEKVDDELGGLEFGLHLRKRALVPIWIFSVFFSVLLYAKYKQLKRIHVKPLP